MAEEKAEDERTIGGKPLAGATFSGQLEVEALKAPTGLSVSVKGGGDPKFVQTLQLVATLTYDDQSTEDVTARAEWKSSDPAKVTVANSGQNKGLCTKVKVGKATITATLK